MEGGGGITEEETFCPRDEAEKRETKICILNVPTELCSSVSTGFKPLLWSHTVPQSTRQNWVELQDFQVLDLFHRELAPSPDSDSVTVPGWFSISVFDTER